MHLWHCTLCCLPNLLMCTCYPCSRMSMHSSTHHRASIAMQSQLMPDDADKVWLSMVGCLLVMQASGLGLAGQVPTCSPSRDRCHAHTNQMHMFHTSPRSAQQTACTQPKPHRGSARMPNCSPIGRVSPLLSTKSHICARCSATTCATRHGSFASFQVLPRGYQ